MKQSLFSRFMVLLAAFSLGCATRGGDGGSGANSTACEHLDCPEGNATDFSLQARWRYTNCTYADASGGFQSSIGVSCSGYAELCGDGPDYTYYELGPSGEGIAPEASALSNAMVGGAAPEFLMYANVERVPACGEHAYAATVVHCENGSSDFQTFDCERVFVAVDVGTCEGGAVSAGDWNKSVFQFVREPDHCTDDEFVLTNGTYVGRESDPKSNDCGIDVNFDGSTADLTVSGSQLNFWGFTITRDGDSLSGGGTGTFSMGDGSCTANANWSFGGFVIGDDAIQLRLAADLTGVVSGCAGVAVPCSFDVETKFLRD